MAFDIKHKFKGSPLPCWKGYSRVPGTAQGAKGSCAKSPVKVKQKGGGTKKVCLPKAKSAFAKTGENISYSRNVARAHYKSDSKMGEKLANAMYKHIKNKI